MKKFILSLILCAAAGHYASAQTAAPVAGVIPKPVSTVETGGKPFQLTAKATVAYSASLQPQAAYLSNALSRSTGFDLKLKEGTKGTISLVLDTIAAPHAEGYRLEVNAKGVRITAHDAAGAFYGIQTFLQMLPPQVHKACQSVPTGCAWTAPATVVEDWPSHPWRGMMLDVARYFYDKDFVKKYIDMMAMYKLNKLQFHFIDDSGWRLEIQKYPRLTEVGAWAGSGSTRLGGYYTQDDIREIVDYASVRGVEVIPEIEFPAHILSAIVAYPWLSCTGVQHEVPKQHFISRDLLCVGKDSALNFLRDVLDETVKLFPSHYVNIGGDEAVYSRWEQCPRCLKRMRDEGLSKVSDLQGWLTNKVAGWMKEKGRTVIGWEEIITRGKVENPVVALIWHNPKDTSFVAGTPHKAILTPCTHMYFDFPESQNPGEPKHATWMPPVSLEKAYSLPAPDWVASSQVMGVQGCFWSDQFIHGTVLQEIGLIDENRSEKYAEYFTFPRLLALSEVAWTPEKQRDYADFTSRLSRQFARLDAKDCGYRVPEPVVSKLEQTPDGGFTYSLSPSVEGAEIRFTTDGTYPTPHSSIYREPVTVAHKSDFMASTYVTPSHYSLPLYTAPDYSAFARFGEFTGQWKPLRVQLTPSPMTLDCTGKIQGDGTYQVTFIPQGGQNELVVDSVRLMKRDELMSASTAATRGKNGEISFTLNLKGFEAGTPFSIVATAYGRGGNDTTGLVFIRKQE